MARWRWARQAIDAGMLMRRRDWPFGQHAQRDRTSGGVVVLGLDGTPLDDVRITRADRRADDWEIA